MKRLIVVLTILACFCGSALAEGMTYGVKAGVNLADMTGDIDNNERKAVFGGGLFLNIALTEIFSIQPELLYMMKGTKSSVRENTSFKLGYFDVPVLFKASLPTGIAFVPHVFAGPSFGFLISAKEERLLEEMDIKEHITSVDYGLVLGTGFDYMIDRLCLLLDVRYSFSLTTILEESEEEEGEELKNVGITFMVGIGYAF
jgi:hypothetical protein